MYEAEGRGKADDKDDGGVEEKKGFSSKATPKPSQMLNNQQPMLTNQLTNQQLGLYISHTSGEGDAHMINDDPDNQNLMPFSDAQKILAKAHAEAFDPSHHTLQ